MIVGERNPRPDDEHVVEIINLVTMCESFNCLPRSGGLLDQDNVLVRKMMIIQDLRAKASDKKTTNIEKKARRATR